MTTPELLDFIRAATAQGQSANAIRQQLLQSGWQAADIEEGIAAADIGYSAPPVPVQPSIEPSSPVLHQEQQVFHSSQQNTSPTTNQPAASQEPVFRATESPFNRPRTNPVASAEIAQRSGTSGVKKLVTTLIIVFILALVGGGGAYAYFAFIKPSSDALLKEAVANTLATPSFKNKTQISIGMTSSLTTLSNLASTTGDHLAATTTIETAADLSTPNDPRIAMHITGNINSPKMSDAVAGDLTIVGTTTYAQISQLPQALLQQLPLMTLFAQHWINFPTASTTSYLGEINSSFTQTFLTGFTGVTNDPKFGETVQKVTALLNKDLIVTATKDFGTEQVGSSTAEHFALTPNKSGIDSFIQDTAAVVSSAYPTKAIPQDQLRQRLVGINDVLDLLQPNKLSIDVWIDKDAPYITKAALGLHLSNTDLISIDQAINPGAPAPSELQNPGTIDLAVTTVTSDQNKPETITAPASSTSLEELIQEAIAYALSGQTPPSGSDNQSTAAGSTTCTNLSSRVSSCSPYSCSMTMNGETATISIDGKSGANCNITMQGVDTSNSTTKCSVPPSQIQAFEHFFDTMVKYVHGDITSDQFNTDMAALPDESSICTSH